MNRGPPVSPLHTIPNQATYDTMTITATSRISTLKAHPWQRPSEDGCSSCEYSAAQNRQLFVAGSEEAIPAAGWWWCVMNDFSTPTDIDAPTGNGKP